MVYGKFNEVANINSTEQLEKTVTSVETWSTTLKLFSLEPNTQYVAYLEALSTKTNMVNSTFHCLKYSIYNQFQFTDQ